MNKKRITKKITRSQAIDLIKDAGHAIFSVDFKKLSGDTRTINGRLGVKKGVKGTGNKTNIKAMGFIRVYEQKKPNTNVKAGFKLVDSRTISGLRINGESYEVK